MKIFKNTAKGTRFQIIGYIVFFTCWIIPIILIDGLSFRGNMGMIVMLGQMGIGGFLIIFGGAVNKRIKDDSNYVIPKNIFRVFKVWQLLLMVALLLFFCVGFINMDEEGGWLTIALSFAMYGCLIAAAVVGIVQQKKNKKNFVSVGGGKMIKACSPINSSIRCSGCNKLLNPDDLRIFEREKYCYSCYMKAFAEKREMDEITNEKNLHTRCSVCNRDFPRSAFHIVDDKFLCDECFKGKFDVDLQ